MGLSFSTASFTGWYVPVPEDRVEAMALLEQFRSILASSKLKIAQNIKYDISVMENYGVSVALPMFDTMLAHYLLEPDQRHNMQLLSEKFLQYSPIPIETLIGKKGKTQGSMKDVDLEAIAEYATEDADITFQLYEVLRPALEEKGLLGSEYYSNHPLFPLENTVCDLNIDMTGRRDEGHEGKPDYIYVIGSDKLSSQLHDVLLEQNKKHMGLDLDFTFNDPNDPNRFYYRSDHYNFAKKKIPVAFFFNGVHEDYHQPTDDVEKIDFDQVQKIGRLVFYMAWDITNRNERLKVDSNKP